MDIASFIAKNPGFIQAAGSLAWTWMAGIVAGILVIVALALIVEATKPGGKKHVTGAIITTILAVIFCGLTGVMAYRYNTQLDKEIVKMGDDGLVGLVGMENMGGMGSVGRAFAAQSQMQTPPAFNPEFIKQPQPTQQQYQPQPPQSQYQQPAYNQPQYQQPAYNQSQPTQQQQPAYSQPLPNAKPMKSFW